MGGNAYVDSSALLKLAFVEDETPALEAALAQRALVSSRLTRVECGRALGRETRRQAILTLDQLIESVYLVDIGTPIVDRAVTLSPVVLRSLDAIQVATALSLADPDLEFVTYDQRMADAARANGLTVVQPGRTASA